MLKSLPWFFFSNNKTIGKCVLHSRVNVLTHIRPCSSSVCGWLGHSLSMSKFLSVLTSQICTYNKEFRVLQFLLIGLIINDDIVKIKNYSNICQTIEVTFYLCCDITLPGPQYIYMPGESNCFWSAFMINIENSILKGQQTHARCQYSVLLKIPQAKNQL